MSTVITPSRLQFNSAIPPLGSRLHRWLAVGLTLICLGVAILPTQEALRSPLTIFGGLLDRPRSTSPESELAALVRLTRERRTLVAQQLHNTSPSEELAQLHAKRQDAMDRLWNTADAALVKKLDLQALNADWAQLERATGHPQIDASALFAQHSRLIDKQLALLSSLASGSS